MKNKFIKAAICCFTIILLLLNFFQVFAQADEKSAKAQGFVEDITDYKLKEAGAVSVQQWIDMSLAPNAGVTSEWYIVALSQRGKYDFSAYEAALLKYLSENEVHSASSRQKYALALIAAGSTNEYIYATLNDSIGKQGVMSFVYGLHLLNNGYISKEHTIASVKDKLLSLQLADGGWAVMGATGDVDVTAMAVQALAPYYKSDAAVNAAVNKALSLLSERQLASGDYASYGVGNLESTAQVLVALSSIGIDCENDSRFIKEGNTLFAGMEKYRLADGTFCHQSGGVYNENATVQAFYSFVAYLRMEENKSPLYVLDAKNPAGLKTPETEIITPTKPEITTKVEENTDKEETASTKDTPVTESTATQEKSTEAISTEAASKNESGSETIAETESVSKADGNNQASSDSSTGAHSEEETFSSNNSKNSGNSSDSPNTHGENYKVRATLIIGIVAVVICGLMYLLKMRNVKNFIFVFAVAVVAIIFVWVTDFQTTDDYYKEADVVKENVVGTVTLTIRCDTIVGKDSSEYIPEDGIILDKSECEIEDGDTVYDVLIKAAAKHRIHMETAGSEDSIYVEGINYIYEFDYGDLSGWIYHVNGVSPSLGCSQYILSDGDEIEWLYTCDLGKDVE